MLGQKLSQSQIARRLGRDRATISREFRRNYCHDREFPDADGYWAMTANDMAHDRHRRICNPGDLDRPFPRSGDHRLQHRRRRKLRAPRYSVSASGRIEPGSCVEDAGTRPSRTRILTLSVFSYPFVFSYFTREDDMEHISLDSKTFERLQRHAKPFVDTPATVINRALDALERITGGLPEARAIGPGERAINPAQLPKLTHTKVLDANLAGREIERPNWNSLLDEMLRLSMKYAGSFEGVRRLCPVNLVAGRKEDEGYGYLSDIDLSVQGQDANSACRAMVVAAQAMGISLDIGFMWRPKENAAYPGERARLQIAGTKAPEQSKAAKKAAV